MKTVDMVYSDNPFVDLLVYYTETLALNCVIKNEQEAFKYETLDISKEADLYIVSVEGRARFESFSEYPRSVIVKTGIPEAMIDACVKNRDNIPESYRETARKLMSQYYIDNYVERNNYYRMLNGKPDIGDPGIKITQDMIPSDLIIDTNLYLHEMDKTAGDLLTSYGVIDTLLETYPTAKYLNYLGSNRIEIYDARIAQKFQLLYIPTIESSEIYDRFKETYELNRVFTIRTVYSNAYKLGSDYYDNFIIVFIIIQTMVDLLSKTQEIIIRKEIFDSRIVKFIFASYGIPYWSEIPLKYQVSMVKNMNTLLKYKSTSKNMIDICSLFGFDDIKVFKYYLLKDRRRDSQGNFIKEYRDVVDENGNVTKELDPEKVYELKFISVPIDEKVDSYLKNRENFNNYDTITLSDPYWDGGRDHDELKKAILEEQFSYTYSQYISIDNLYDLTELSFQLPYFINILFDDSYYEDLLTVSIPTLSSNRLKLSSVFCYLFALAYLYRGVEDSIMDTQSKVLHIKGFNFKADLAALSQYVSDNGLTPEVTKLSDFTIPTTAILTFKQMMDIFVNNKKVYDHLQTQMVKADNYRIYNIYKTLYESLMITEYSTDFFKLPDGSVASTYTEFLRYYEGALYVSIANLKDIQNKEEREMAIGNAINNTIYALGEFLDSTTFKYIYSFLPVVSVDYIKQYITTVISFFKSYKVTLLGMSSIYTIGDRFDNWVGIVDGCTIESEYNKSDNTDIFDIKSIEVDMTKKDYTAPIDKINIESYFE